MAGRLYRRARLILITSGVIFLSVIQLTNGFNVDYQYPLIFELPARQLYGEESYFGLSLDVHQFNNKTSVIIGAPRARSSYLTIYHGRGTGKPTGSAFHCPVRATGNGIKCEEINFRRGMDAAEPRPHFDYPITHSRAMEQMAVGASIASRNGNDEALICAPTFSDEAYRNTGNHDYFPVGQCFVYSASRREVIKKLYPASSERLRIKILGDIAVHYYSHAEAGFTAQFSSQGDRLYLGAPGFFNWRGTILYYDLRMPLELGFERFIEDYGDLEPDYEGYVGYSLSIAQFGPGLGEAVIAGAPRDDSLRGSVYILHNLRQTQDSTGTKARAQKIKIKAPPLIQMGHYFGASVLAIDVDRDGRTELLVGAPLFGDHGSGDRGLVVVYRDPTRSELIRRHVYQGDADQYLYGSSAPSGRFGTSMANAGDIDADGYNDVAIGSPYEDDGAGSIYIYFGTQFGMFRDGKQQVQRIAAQSHLPAHGLKGFGITISGGRDVDENLYPDLVIGSYLSEKAVLLRSRPVAELEAVLDPDVFKINLENTTCTDANRKQVACFKLKYCLTYAARKSFDPLTVDVTIRLDTILQDQGFDQLRGYFAEGPSQGSSIHEDRLDFREDPRNRRETAVPQPSYKICRDIRVNMLPSDKIKHQVFQKMQFNMTYQVLEPHGQFCPKCPLLAQRRDVIVEIPFETGCGPDNICKSDFRLNVRAFNPQDKMKPFDRVTLGFHREIALEINLQNVGENAFDTSVVISFPKKHGLHLKSLDKLCTESSTRLSNDPLDSSFSPPPPGRSGQLQCDTADGYMKTNDANRYAIVFETSNVKPDLDRLDFNVFVFTKSEQTASSQNKTTLSLPIDKEAAIKISGKPSMSSYVYEHSMRRTNDTVPFSVVWTITKYKSSPVKKVAIEIMVPRWTPKRRLSQLSVLSYENLSGVHCETVQEQKNPSPFVPTPDYHPLPMPEMEPVMPQPQYERKKRRSRRRRDIEDVFVEDVSLLLECKANPLLCVTYKCHAGPLGAGTQIAQFRLNMAINLTAVEIDSASNYSSIEALLPGRAAILDAQIVGSERESNTLVSVYFQRAPHVQTISKWIIWLAIAAGIIILIGIIFVLVNVGFFQRKEKEELDKLVSKRRHFAGIPDGAEDPEPSKRHLRSETPERVPTPISRDTTPVPAPRGVSRAQNPLDQSEIRPLNEPS